MKLVTQGSTAELQKQVTISGNKLFKSIIAAVSLGAWKGDYMVEMASQSYWLLHI